jgi:hypothetical protein
VMLLLLAITAAAVFGLSCGDILAAVTCDKPGLTQLIWTFVLAIIANQSTFTISPQVVSPTVPMPVAPPPAEQVQLMQQEINDRLAAFRPLEQPSVSAMSSGVPMNTTTNANTQPMPSIGPEGLIYSVTPSLSTPPQVPPAVG